MPKFIGWVPTQPEFISTFFEICPLTASDIVYDLGSGDGRLLFTALDKGAGKCVGIDIDPELIKVSREEARDRGVEDKVTFIESDVLEVGLSEASVILCYLFPSASAALKTKFERELKTGTRVVMESFRIPGWKLEKVVEKNSRIFYLYIIPAEQIEEEINTGSILDEEASGNYYYDDFDVL